MIHALAPYATHTSRSRGRLIQEADCPLRTHYQRDRDRIVHSAAFRRLEYKTQVFINHEGDHYRTRLTHSIEVAQLARAMARQLQVDEDLSEAIALAHDLGHTPFGHAGEEGLQAMMQPYGGFDHNAHALHIVTKLEQRYAAFDGLNLAWETLEGLVKHNGALRGTLPYVIAEYDRQHPLELHSNAGLEAQIAAIADDIAYNNHDVEDGIRAGFFSLEALRDIPYIDSLITHVDTLYGGLPAQRRIHEVLRRLITAMIDDAVQHTRQQLAHHAPTSVEEIRAAPMPYVAFSPEMEATNQQLKRFLFTHMYRHFRVNRMTQKAIKVVQDLFDFFIHHPECLPTEWQLLTRDQSELQRARIISDFIAGMTDRFALLEHKRIFYVYE
jgi:dGTPase